MGKFNSIADGRISGKVGNLVFYQVNGKPRVRSVGHSSKPPTLPQLRGRVDMRIVISFLKPLLSVVRLGYGKKAKHSSASAYNLAVSYHRKYALEGEYPDRAIAYDRVMLSQGKLMPALEPSAVLVADVLQFSWECPAWVGWPDLDSSAVMVAYFPEANAAAYELSGPKRSEGAGVLPIPPEYAGQRMELYLFFVSEGANGVSESVSDSVYVGRLGG